MIRKPRPCPRYGYGRGSKAWDVRCSKGRYRWTAQVGWARSGLPTWRLPRRRSHLSFCHSLSRSESNSSCSNRLLLMASMDGGARNVLFEVAAAGRALKEGPAATWDARPGADAAAPTLETAAVAVWWRVKLEPGCPSSSSNHSSSESHCALASAMPEV